MRVCAILLIIGIAGILRSDLIGQSGVIISPQTIPTEPGAILNVQSPHQGVLLPKTQTTSILFPVDGLMIFDTIENSIMLYDSIEWVPLVKGPFTLFYADHDGDVWGDALSAIYAPFAPAGYVPGLDCDDTNPNIAPGLPELCDLLDNDCNPLTADGVDELTLGTPCDGADADNCIEGVIECVDGFLICSDLSDDNLELCDALDNDCDGSIDEGCAIVTIGFSNLQFPPSVLMLQGTTPAMYGQVYAAGVTEAPGQGAGIMAQLGYGPDGSDPALGGWTWVNATYNTDNGNSDEYQATLTIMTFGAYDYAYRYSGDYGLSWTYADLDGTVNGYQTTQAGHLEVTDDLCNGMDDDGDMLVDENCPDLNLPCDGPDDDFCPEGVVICLPAGDCGCTDDMLSHIEYCNGIDDDCNGFIDDDCLVVNIEWGNLQFPSSIEMVIGTTPVIYGQVYSAGITNGVGQGNGITAQVGYGPDGSDPGMGGWTWVNAAYNADSGNNDEYQGMLTIPMTGTYDYAYRFSGDFGTTWTYADLNDGSADGYQAANSGHLEVIEPCNGVDDDGDVEIDEGCPVVTIGYAVLQFPPAILMLPGTTPFIFGQVYALGVTDAAGQGPLIIAQLGYGTNGSDPSSGGWTWVNAGYNADVGNNDEYQATVGVMATGIYDYAYRFSGNYGQNWTYADLDGTLNGYQTAQAGHMDVTDDLCNDIDDDGDMMIDENCPDLGLPCDGTDEDFCADGTVFCLPDGSCSCNDDMASHPEICNGVDDDCDGEIDNDCPVVIIGWAVLQFPPSILMMPGNTPTIYGRVYANGVTDMGGQGAGILAQVGYGADGSDPSLGGWTWVVATYNVDVGNDDEYQGVLNVAVAGAYDYAYRFSGDGGATWIYADLDGILDGYDPTDAGALTVN